MPYLPMTRDEVLARGWDTLDFVYICGDAYVDHPSFGAAIICRTLEAAGYSVGIIAQPDWKRPDDFFRLGRPRLAWLVSAGNLDSMVDHYTVAKKRRHQDMYTPGGEGGKRPDRAVIVYCNKLREQDKTTPILIGGIEASLRRLAHYDYWDDKVRRSILLDSGADLLMYGMGERSILEIAEALDGGVPVAELTYLPGTVYKTRDRERPENPIFLPTYRELLASKQAYAQSFLLQYQNTDPFTARPLVEEYDEGLVVQNPPNKPLTTAEMDRTYALPFMRGWHPAYDEAGGVPALSEVKFSLVSNRGCFGSCNFCALAFHQGRIISTRSHASLLREAEAMTYDPDFKGYIHDVGGPTANFRHPACAKQLKSGACQNRQCLFPTPCPNLDASHKDYIALLRTLREIPRVKMVFIRSGIRFDSLLAEGKDDFLRELCQYHVSGQLKVAPEHISQRVLDKMGKPARDVYERFVQKYDRMNEKLGLKQYLVPYLMSSHPGCTLEDAVTLAEYLHETGRRPEQVQDFYPTPGTLSTCMYYTGIDPRTGKKVFVPKKPHEKAMQRALIQYSAPQNRELVEEALRLTHREDLIGYGPHCLLRPRKPELDRSRGGRPGSTGKGNDRAGNGKAGAAAGRGTGNRPAAGGKPGTAPGNPTGFGGKTGGKPAAKKTIRNVHKKKNG